MTGEDTPAAGDGRTAQTDLEGRPVAERATADDPVDEPTMGDLFDELEELEETVDSPEERQQVRETMRLAMTVKQPGVFGKAVIGFDRADAAEALLGTLLFGIPMFVEGGTQEVGVAMASHPFNLVGTVAATVGLVVGILYVAEIQDVRIYRPFFGVIPRRLVGVLAIAMGTSLVMMTLWGRVDWGEPWLAFCQCAVAFVPMAIGAALGDILPG